MNKQLHRVQYLGNEWPGGLKNCAEAASEIHISEARLLDFADGGYAPHYRIDGGAPYFKVAELKRWAAENLATRHSGRSLPDPIRICPSPEIVKELRRVPPAIAQAVGLYDITDEIRRTGIYFLCRDATVLYVGQSRNAHYRVCSHQERWEFSDAFFLPWPGDDLDRMESALIRALKPSLNGIAQDGRVHTPCRSAIADVELLKLVGLEAP